MLLLDEPLSALDPFLRIQMRAELRRWQKELGLTFIHVTHSQEEAMALADTMVVMNHGLIEQVGSPHEVYNHPASEFVARFMGGHNVIDTAGGKVARAQRPHADRARRGAVDARRPALPAPCTDVEYQGTYVLLGLQRAGRGAAPAGVSVMLPEAAFVARPTRRRQRAPAWTPSAAHARPGRSARSHGARLQLQATACTEPLL